MKSSYKQCWDNGYCEHPMPCTKSSASRWAPICSTKVAMFICEEPPFVRVLCATFCNSLALVLNKFTSWTSSCMALTFLLISSLRISPPLGWRSKSTPIFHSCVMYWQFKIWSEKKGQPSMGTPVEMLSKVEFQPQWVRNAEIEGWERTFIWGTQGTMRAWPLMRSTKLEKEVRNCAWLFESSCRMRSGRITHRNGWLLISRPHASSQICSMDIVAMLPKETNVTVDGFCWSNQTKDVSSSSHRVLLVWETKLLAAASPSTLKLGEKRSGPTGHTLKPLACMASRTKASSSSNVLSRTKSHSCMSGFWNWEKCFITATSFSRKAEGKCLTFTKGGTPGTQVIGCSCIAASSSIWACCKDLANWWSGGAGRGRRPSAKYVSTWSRHHRVTADIVENPITGMPSFVAGLWAEGI